MAIERISGVNSGYQVNTGGQMDVKPVENIPLQTGDDNRSNNISQEAATFQQSDTSDDAEKRGFSDETVGQELNDIKKRMGNTECKFGIDEATNRITIKIVDKDTKKVIKEVPPEKTLKMIAKVWEMAGILVDEKL
ncbi:flagellar protein FlaG [Lachnospiraceae bacterium HCP1S3_C3]